MREFFPCATNGWWPSHVVRSNNLQPGADGAEMDTSYQVPVATPMASGLAARLAYAQLKSRQLDPSPLLERSRISAENLTDDARISVTSQIKFLELASEAIKDEWIGLTIAESFDLRELGMLYYVAASSHHLGGALRRLERYVRVSNEAVTMSVLHGRECRVGFSYTGVARHRDRHQAECFIVALLRLCRHLTARKIVPTSVRFAHHRSRDLRRIQKVLHCEPEFDTDGDEIVLEPNVVELPLVSHDPFLNQLMVKDLEAALASRTSRHRPVRAMVENAIVALLPHGKAQFEVVAKRLNMSERTLARRLAREGHTFGDILEELRRDLTVHYLEDPDMAMSQIAWRLGFTHASALSHACRRWFGKSPVEYRRAKAG